MSISDGLQEFYKLAKQLKDITEIINTTGKKVFIILGAHNKEEHIIKFALMNLDSYVICVSQHLCYQNECVDNLCCIKADFNAPVLWEYQIMRFNNIAAIIVDNSTAKFFDEDKFNIKDGSIMKHIKEIIKRGATFYSPCCFMSINAGKPSYYYHNVFLGLHEGLDGDKVRFTRKSLNYMRDNIIFGSSDLEFTEINYQDYPIQNPNWIESAYFMVTKKV